MRRLRNNWWKIIRSSSYDVLAWNFISRINNRSRFLPIIKIQWSKVEKSSQQVWFLNNGNFGSMEKSYKKDDLRWPIWKNELGWIIAVTIAEAKWSKECDCNRWNWLANWYEREQVKRIRAKTNHLEKWDNKVWITGIIDEIKDSVKVG